MAFFKQIKQSITVFSVFFFRLAHAEDIKYCPDGTEMDSSIGCFEAPGGIIDPSTGFYDLIIKSADLMLTFAGSIAIIMIIISGLQYATAMGDDEKVDKAKRNMKWASIGLGISLSAYLIVEFVLKNIA